MTTRSILSSSQRRIAVYHHLRRLNSESSSRARLIPHHLLLLQRPASARTLLPLIPRPASLRTFATTRTKMAADDDYMAFLAKANQDPAAEYPRAQLSRGDTAGFKTLDAGAVVPPVIQDATKEAFYVSEADEPFMPVCLAWDEAGKGMPSEEEFATLIHHPDPASADIEIQDPADWDPQGQYGAIIEAVTKAGKGNDLRVYRVARGGARVEYWVVTTDGKGKDARLVGAKALAIES